MGPILPEWLFRGNTVKRIDNPARGLAESGIPDNGRRVLEEGPPAALFSGTASGCPPSPVNAAEMQTGLIAFFISAANTNPLLSGRSFSSWHHAG
jgi:hypothetical protein